MEMVRIPTGPRLTRRMDRLKADLREHGFGMFEGALDPETTARVRERVLEQGAAERRIDYGTTNISVEPHDDVHIDGPEGLATVRTPPSSRLRALIRQGPIVYQRVLLADSRLRTRITEKCGLPFHADARWGPATAARCGGEGR